MSKCSFYKKMAFLASPNPVPFKIKLHQLFWTGRSQSSGQNLLQLCPLQAVTLGSPQGMLLSRNTDTQTDTQTRSLVSPLGHWAPAAPNSGSQQAFPNTESKLNSNTRMTSKSNSQEMSVLGGCRGRSDWEAVAMSRWEVPPLQPLCE